MIARAAGSSESPCSDSASSGIANTIESSGSRQPITPVEHGSTASPPLSPSDAAAASHTASASPTPVPSAHTFEILLFTRIACSALPSDSRLRPILIGAPQKALRVKTAAQLDVGLSSTTAVRFIVAVIFASFGVNVKPLVPTRKPAGSSAIASRAARCASSDANSVGAAARTADRAAPRACTGDRASV